MVPKAIRRPKRAGGVLDSSSFDLYLNAIDVHMEAEANLLIPWRLAQAGTFSP
jgi:hypothetical protein